MSRFKNDAFLRWIVLASVLLNIAFNLFSVFGLINENTIGEISQQHRNSFTPADFTFSIWGLIYIVYIVYAIAQFLPAQREKIIYHELTIPFIAVNVLSIVWLFLFSYELIGFSALIIFSMLIISFLLFHRTRNARNNHRTSAWLTIPFSLLFGWLAVAFLANLTTWSVSAGNPLKNDITIAMLIIIALTGVIINLRYRDWLYPLVIAWANFGIWSANRELNDRVATVAISVVFFLIAWSIISLLIRAMKPTRLTDNYYN